MPTEPLLPDALASAVRSRRYTLGARTVCLYDLPSPPPPPPKIKHVKPMPAAAVRRVQRLVSDALTQGRAVFMWPELVEASEGTMETLRAVLATPSFQRFLVTRGLTLFGTSSRPYGLLRRRDAASVASALIESGQLAVLERVDALASAVTIQAAP